MNRSNKFRVNTASEVEIQNHLTLCDANFIPPLSDRIEISSYSHKILTKANRFEIWIDSTLVGLVAAYSNDNERQIAYVTSVSILSTWQGKGLARKLMQKCIEHAKLQGFREVELEINSGNDAAIKLYESIGFVSKSATSRAVIMHMNIRGYNK